MKNLIRRYGHVWILSYVFLYVPWFAHLERTITSNYQVIHTAFDDLIPFNEYFIVPYLLWFLYVAGAVVYFFFTSREEYYRLCIFLFTGMTASLLICTIFPNGTDFRPVVDPSKNVFTWIVSALYTADTCTNVFPSIHVFNSIAVHIAVRNSKSLKAHPLVRLGSLTLMASICLATVFLKQHSVIDGFGAALLACFIYQFVYDGSYAVGKKKVTEKALN